MLVGLLAVTAVGCKSSSDSPSAQPGVAAGKVVEVSGNVTVRHNDVARPLAKGEAVEGDDVIVTGADGNAIIELSHNLARWELGPNKTSKVKESSAWGLAKKSGDVAVVEQDTAAAGRPAERSAADTSVSAHAESAKPEPPSAQAPAAAVAPEPAKAAPPAEQAPKPKRAREVEKDVLDIPSGGGGGAPSKTLRGPSVDSEASGGGTTESATRGGGAKTATSATADQASKPTLAQSMSPADADKAATDVVLANEKSLKACLTKDAQAVSVTIKIAANGTATAVVTAKAPVPASVQSCIKAAAAKMKFAKVATTVRLELER
ncbi:MAG TPA: hypothetical protein VIV40_25005 [Kofleriaceae bacterium]